MAQSRQTPNQDRSRVTSAALTLCLVMGCSNSTGPITSAATDTVANTAAAGPAVENKLKTTNHTTNHQTITFSEGTNMAVARNPRTGDYLLSLQGSLFALPSTGGTAAALTDYFQDAREPQVAPDGNSAIYHGYANGSWDLFELQLADNTIKTLTKSPFDDREPVWSPDGKSIAFSSDRSGSYDIWLLHLADGSLNQITHTQQDDYSPSFAADGQTLYFARNLQRAESELRRHSMATAEGTTVLREAGVISGVSASPYSDYVAYQLMRRDRAGHAHTELKLITPPERGGDDAFVLSRPGDDVFPFRATWNPTGLSAAINGRLWTFAKIEERSAQRFRSPPTEIPFTASVKLQREAWTRKQRDYSTLSTPALGIVAPALSHGGGRVAFTALGDLWQWNLVSDELVQLTDDRFAEASPAYQPNGQNIAFVSDRSGAPQLWLHNLADGTQRLLDDKITAASFPSWSPDGQHLAYFGSLQENPLGGQLMLANVQTGTSRRIGLPTPAQPLSWSQDSKHLAVAVLAPYSRKYREGVYELMIFDTAGKETNRINLQPHRSPLDVRLTPDGKGVGYVQGGQLWYQPIDAGFNKQGPARKIGDTLADMPAWSGNGREVLALSGDRLRRFEVASGTAIANHIVPLNYARDVHNSSWTLRTGRLFDGSQSTYRRNLDIVIRNNRIERITPHDNNNPQPVIDVTDYAVMPGLFEMHAHMGMLSEAQGRSWLAWGITSVRDPGSSPYLAKERQETWDSGRRPGPRSHITGYLSDGTRVFYPIAEGLDEETLQNALDRTKKLQLDFIKTYVRLPDSQQQQVVEFAHANGMPVSSHELFPAAAIGTDHVEHIGGTSRRGYQPKVSTLGHSYNDVVELLVGSGMGITPTLVLPAWAVIFAEDKDLFATAQFERFYGPAALKSYEGLARRFGDGAKSYHRANAALLQQLVKRDALLVTGTDSPFVPYGPGLHAELRLYERAGLKPWQVLRAATAKSAQAAGVGAELGQIAQGMLADLVVVKGDPLKTLKDADNVILTVKGGRRFELAELLRK